MIFKKFNIERLKPSDGGGYFICHKKYTTIMTDAQTKQKAVIKIKKLLKDWKIYKYQEMKKEIREIRN